MEHLLQPLEPGDQFLFFFAGHGVLDGDDQLLLMPGVRYGRIRHRVETIGMELLRDETSGRGLSRLFILDCCRSNLEKHRKVGNRFEGGTVLRNIGARKAPGEIRTPPESIAILCACEDGQQAAEIPSGQGLFTAALAQNLRMGQTRGEQILFDNCFVDSLAESMQSLAREKKLSIEQRPLWIQNGSAPLIYERSRSTCHRT